MGLTIMRSDLFLAWRFLREGGSQTLLVVLGATIGITVVFFLTALVTAVERTMIAQTLDVVPHVVVRRPDEEARSTLASAPGQVVQAHLTRPAQRLRSIDDWAAWLSELEKARGVVAVSPTAAGPALAARGLATRAVTLMGVDPERFATVIALRERLRRGSFRLTSTEAVVGVDLASDLGVEVGDRILVRAGEGRQASFLVAGVFDLGNREVNRRWVLVSLHQGQTLLDLPGGVSSLDLRVSDIWEADRIAAWSHAHTGLTAESWQASSGQLAVAIRSQRGATVLIRLFVSVAVVIGIGSVLLVSVVQRTRQIGILRAMGATRATVRRVFLWQGAAIGLAGAVLGSGLGSMLALWSEASTRNPDGSATYPIQLPASLYVTVWLLAFASGLVASVLPARRASRLEPAVAIRHD